MDWILLKDKFYRKIPLYQIHWDITQLSKYDIAIANQGGPIALSRNEKNAALVISTQKQTHNVHVYSSSGNLLYNFNVQEKVVGMGWSYGEQFVCICEDGSARLFKNLQGDYTQFHLGLDTNEYGILGVKVYSTGLVALTGHFKFIAINDLSEPRAKFLHDPNLTSEPESWLVIPPSVSLSKHIEVLVSTFDQLLLLDSSGISNVSLCEFGPFRLMSLCPNGKLIALYSISSIIYVASPDFQNVIARIETHLDKVPTQMEWCGVDSIVVNTNGSMIVFGPQGDSFTFPGKVFLSWELDCLRILTSKSLDILQLVPVSIVDVFKIGSTAPGSILYEARNLFQKKNPRADECLRAIRPELENAVTACINAACHDFDVDTQKQLLRAASFGKCFLDSFDSEIFVNGCKTIRILNALRGPEIGIPMTFGQYKSLSQQQIIKRLLNRNLHLLALKISEYLELDTHGILVHWACFRIKNANEDDSTLARLIIEKFQQQGHDFFSFSEIAKAAHEMGRRELAIKLMDQEPNASSQIPLLLSMGEDELALVKSIESADTDLIYLAMLHIKRKLALADFFKLVNDKPVAVSLIEYYGRQNDVSMLRNFYYQDDRRADSAKLSVLEAFERLDTFECIEKLKTASKLYENDKNHTFEFKMTDEFIKLLNLQMALEREYNQSFINLTLKETLFKLLLLGHAIKAVKIKSDFKVPDKSFWWIKVRVFIQSQNWEGLDKFVKSTPKFGLLSVIELLVFHGNRNQAQVYADAFLKTGPNSSDRASLEEMLRHTEG